MSLFLNLALLAQTEAADKAIGLAERLVQGGPAIILGFFCLILGWVVYYQNKQYRELEQLFRETLVGQVATATENAEKLTQAITSTNIVVAGCDKTMASTQDVMNRMNARIDATER